MIDFACVVDGAPEHVQDAAIHLDASSGAEVIVHTSGVAPAKIAYPSDTYLSKMPGEVRSYSGDAL
jgi:hypothetical protein